MVQQWSTDCMQRHFLSGHWINFLEKQMSKCSTSFTWNKSLNNLQMWHVPSLSVQSPICSSSLRLSTLFSTSSSSPLVLSSPKPMPTMPCDLRWPGLFSLSNEKGTTVPVSSSVNCPNSPVQSFSLSSIESSGLCNTQHVSQILSQICVPCGVVPDVKTLNLPFIVPNVHLTSFQRDSRHWLNWSLACEAVVLKGGIAQDHDRHPLLVNDQAPRHLISCTLPRASCSNGTNSFSSNSEVPLRKSMAILSCRAKVSVLMIVDLRSTIAHFVIVVPVRESSPLFSLAVCYSSS